MFQSSNWPNQKCLFFSWKWDDYLVLTGLLCPFQDKVYSLPQADAGTLLNLSLISAEIAEVKICILFAQSAIIR